MISSSCQLRAARRLRRRSALLAPLAIGVLAGAPGSALSSAAAAPMRSTSSASTSCADYTWQKSPKVIVHESEFLDGGGDSGSAADMVNAVQRVVDQFNAIGATSAKITKVETTTDPFVFASGNKDGAIHVGFGTRDDIKAANNGNDADGLTGPAEATADCSIKQADILFPDQNSPDADSGATVMWDFGTPFGTHDGRKFYDATATDSASSTWFRPSFLHELEHAWGFKHVQGEYTFMTHRLPAGFPWANRPSKDSVRSLPYEVGVLRSLYPASGTRYDVAALNTWWGPPYTTDDDAGSQIDLCKPSRGDAFSDAVDGSDTTGLTCGVNSTKTVAGSTEVCSGDTLRTRYTLANYSTASMNVTTILSFSTDEQYTNDSSEPKSSDAGHDVLDAESSDVFQQSFTVPPLAAGTYRPILYTISEDEAADANSVKADWIPLRGTITVPASCNGPSPKQG